MKGKFEIKMKEPMTSDKIERSLLKFLTFVFLGGILVSCSSNSQSPGVEYMPDMYRSPAIEAYVDYWYPDSLHARKPVEGTVPFSDEYLDDPYNLNLPYPYPNNTQGYENAGKELENPLEFTPEVYEEGKQLFSDFCVHCHGKDGGGQGSIVENGKFPPPPSYSKQLKDLSDGKIFHSITYGKGLMGAHAAQLDKRERWVLVHYVNVLQEGGGNPFEGENKEMKEETPEGDTTMATETDSLQMDTVQGSNDSLETDTVE